MLYTPRAFNQPDAEAQRQLVLRHPLGLLISNGEAGPLATPLPFLLQVDAQGEWVLQGHLSRANPHLKALEQDAPVLVVFQGEQGYITPAWYEEKARSGKAVPTWNYLTLHCRGALTRHDNADWLREQVGRLTAQQEQGMPQPWAVNDAPAPYIDSMIKAIVGIEIRVTQREGKWKLNQNRSLTDRQQVADGLQQQQNTSLAAEMRRTLEAETPDGTE
ncbi:MAG: FMN-binding negative transcriptional regulator [Pantoea sp.]|uniref:FMN-binding negative transcriptional regulator n=1 Tax=Pantoea sp. TaxID=69393 RepID=UPI00239FA13C|nr:FMN-binding negative transcriptional regulator [Pantoea sp.]MDE1185302.1 FMN-binding negative transcriptional regulator [Pantoea sp.]